MGSVGDLNSLSFTGCTSLISGLHSFSLILSLYWSFKERYEVNPTETKEGVIVNLTFTGTFTLSVRN